MLTRYNLNDKQGNSDLDITENNEDGNWMWAGDVLLVEETYKRQIRGLQETASNMEQDIAELRMVVEDLAERLLEAERLAKGETK